MDRSTAPKTIIPKALSATMIILDRLGGVSISTRLTVALLSLGRS